MAEPPANGAPPPPHHRSLDDLLPDQVRLATYAISTVIAVVGLANVVVQWVTNAQHELRDRANAEIEFFDTAYNDVPRLMPAATQEPASRDPLLAANFAILVERRLPDLRISPFMDPVLSGQRNAAFVQICSARRRALTAYIQGATPGVRGTSDALDRTLKRTAGVIQPDQRAYQDYNLACGAGTAAGATTDPTAQRVAQAPTQATNEANASATDPLPPPTQRRSDAVTVNECDQRPAAGRELTDYLSDTGWRVDIFWCGRAGDANSQARETRNYQMACAAYARLHGGGAEFTSSEALSRIRLRRLDPARQRQGTGYPTNESIVRYDPSDAQERGLASHVIAYALSGAAPPATLSAANTPTPRYISVFSCGP